MADSSYVGVILSAGKGSRIDPFSAQWPKPLLPIGDRPILAHQVDLLRGLGIRKIFFVVGHLMNHIITTFGDGERYGVAIEYVEQQETLGIAHAVGTLESRIDQPFLLLLGDIFYVPEDLGAMLRRFDQGDTAGVLAIKRTGDPEEVRKNFTVEMTPEGHVTRVVEKPRKPASDLKGCGIYVFGPDIFDAIRVTPRTAQRDEYELTNSIQILIDRGRTIAALEVVAWDSNITYPRDLLECNLRWLRHRKMTRYVAPTARLHPQSVVEGSVVGARVVLDHPIHVRDSVLLPGTRVDGKEDLRRAILAPGIRIHCPD